MKTTANIKKLTLALCLPIIMACVDVMALSVALDAIVKTFHTPIYQTQWLFTAYMIANSAFLMMIGQIADVYGRKRVLLLGISGFTLASLVAAVSLNFWILVCARLVQGVASAAIVTTSISLITNHFALPERSRVFAKWVFSVGLGLAFGPLIGGLLVSLVNWRFIFLINLPIGLVSYWMIQTTIAESKSESGLKKLEISNSLLLFIAVLLLSIFLTEGEAFGWFSSFSLIMIAGFFLVISGFIYLAARNNHLPIYLEFCRNKAFMVGILSGFFSYFFMYAWLFLFSLYLQEVREFTPLFASMICLPFSIAFAFSPLFISKYLTKLQEEKLIKLSFIGIAFSFIVMAIKPLTMPYSITMIAFAILGLTIALINTLSMIVATKDISKTISGLASGVIFTIRWLGGAIGVVTTTVFFHAISFDWLKEKLPAVDLSKIILMGHLSNIKNYFATNGDFFLNMAKKSFTVSLSYSCLMLAFLAMLCFILVKVIKK